MQATMAKLGPCHIMTECFFSNVKGAGTVCLVGCSFSPASTV